ncbi:MAG: hypothetical protein KF764_12355 [Labilithrix sp.]|nr:hypothetical protein [Labilithrix sp.]
MRYTLGHWDELGVSLCDAAVPLDNNAPERAPGGAPGGRYGSLRSGASLGPASSSSPSPSSLHS